jgi:hypothetical protein
VQPSSSEAIHPKRLELGLDHRVCLSRADADPLWRIATGETAACRTFLLTLRTRRASRVTRARALGRMLLSLGGLLASNRGPIVLSAQDRTL